MIPPEREHHAPFAGVGVDLVAEFFGDEGDGEGVLHVAVGGVGVGGGGWLGVGG